MAGLISYGTYIPRHRLKRSDIGAALGLASAGRGTRAVAAYDEDAVSMAVEASRRALWDLDPHVRPSRLLFASAVPPYLDKTNANVIHAALGLERTVLAVDMVGSVRSGVGAFLLGAESASPTLTVMSDIRTGLPGGADERDGGDGAAAFVFAEHGEPIVEIVAQASATDEFLDRWRLPGAAASRVWEERFGEHAYRPLAEAAFADALKQTGITPGEIDVLVASGTHGRAVKGFCAGAGVAYVADDLAASVGNAGTAQPGLLLANVLDRALPGQTIVMVVLADGATAMVLRVTGAITDYRRAPAVEEQIAEGVDSLSYADFLSWRGFLTRELPRRPDPVGPAAPPSHRSVQYKFGFVGHRCEECGTAHLPAVRVCVNCKAIDRMVKIPMADKLGSVTTFTLDHLAYSPSPPVIAAVVDFDGGGRFNCELTDADPGRVEIGDRVEMTFRRIMTAGGVHNYFWKARPVGRAAGADEADERGI